MSAPENVTNNEFNTYLRMFKNYLSKLSPEDQRLATAWITRLKNYHGRFPELKLRNKIVCSLIMQMQMGALTPPFNNQPRFTSLDEVQPLTELTAENVYPAGFRIPQLMEQSPDQGAFLVSQPVPKCGAFCYLAVVSRPPNN